MHGLTKRRLLSLGSTNPELETVVIRGLENVTGGGSNAELVSSSVPGGINVSFLLFDSAESWLVHLHGVFIMPDDETSVSRAGE